MTHQDLARNVVDVAYLTGECRLRSGATSSEYFDKYRFEAEPGILREIAEHLAPRLPTDFEILAGLEMGGVPIATMLSQVTGKPSRFVWKKATEYGTRLFAEGGGIKGKRLLVIEDANQRFRSRIRRSTGVFATRLRRGVAVRVHPGNALNRRKFWRRVTLRVTPKSDRLETLIRRKQGAMVVRSKERIVGQDFLPPAPGTGISCRP